MAVLLVAATAAAACSSSTDSTFNDTPPPFTGDDAQAPQFGNGDGGSEAGTKEGGAACLPIIPQQFSPTWLAPTKTNACTTPALGEYYDECILTLSQPDGKTKCETWKAANAACAACIEPTNNSGPIQWFRNRFYQTLNVAGCIAITQNKLAETDCGAAYGAAVQCKRDACDGCFETGVSTFDDFKACQQAAGGQGVCKSYEAVQSDKCMGYKDPGAPALECFPTSTDTQRDHFTRVEGIFCGP